MTTAAPRTVLDALSALELADLDPSAGSVTVTVWVAPGVTVEGELMSALPTRDGAMIELRLVSIEERVGFRLTVDINTPVEATR